MALNLKLGFSDYTSTGVLSFPELRKWDQEPEEILIEQWPVPSLRQPP